MTAFNAVCAAVIPPVVAVAAVVAAVCAAVAAVPAVSAAVPAAVAAVFAVIFAIIFAAPDANFCPVVTVSEIPFATCVGCECVLVHLNICLVCLSVQESRFYDVDERFHKVLFVNLFLTADLLCSAFVDLVLNTALLVLVQIIEEVESVL